MSAELKGCTSLESAPRSTRPSHPDLPLEVEHLILNGHGDLNGFVGAKRFLNTRSFGYSDLDKGGE